MNDCSATDKTFTQYTDDRIVHDVIIEFIVCTGRQSTDTDYRYTPHSKSSLLAYDYSKLKLVKISALAKRISPYGAIARHNCLLTLLTDSVTRPHFGAWGFNYGVYDPENFKRPVWDIADASCIRWGG